MSIIKQDKDRMSCLEFFAILSGILLTEKVIKRSHVEVIKAGIDINYKTSLSESAPMVANVRYLIWIDSKPVNTEQLLVGPSLKSCLEIALAMIGLQSSVQMSNSLAGRLNLRSTTDRSFIDVRTQLSTSSTPTDIKNQLFTTSSRLVKTIDDYDQYVLASTGQGFNKTTMVKAMQVFDHPQVKLAAPLILKQRN